MANNILFGNCDKHIIKVRVQELNRGPQGVQGPAGRDGVVQYTAGNGIEISDENVISATGTGAVWGAITGVLSNQADLNVALSTKASNDAVREAQNTASQAVTAANAAVTAASGANNSISAFSDYLNLNSVTEYNTESDYSFTEGTGTIYDATISVAKNSTNSVASIYGTITLTNTNNTGSITVRLNVDTGLRPPTGDEFVVPFSGMAQALETNNAGGLDAALKVTIDNQGRLTFQGYHAAGTTVYFRQYAMPFFLKTFSETQQ